MKLFPSIEPLLRRWRIWVIKPDLPRGGVGLDIGCDEPPLLLDQTKDTLGRWIGTDIVAEPREYDNIKIVRQDLQKKLAFQANTFDVVTMLAVLEHMKHPEALAREVYRVLKPGGSFLITVPSPRNKPVLELFSKLGLVREEMIDQHENYFSHQDLHKLLKKAGFSQVAVQGFQLGLNTYARAIK